MKYEFIGSLLISKYMRLKDLEIYNLALDLSEEVWKIYILQVI